MAAKSNITKKKAPSYINGLKAMTSWVFGKTRRRDELENIIEIYGLDNNIFKRFLLYSYNSPHVVYFVNKYLNHLYNFNKFNTVDLVFSYMYLMDINRINKKSIPDSLLYLKSTELNDRNKTKIKELLEEYFDNIHNKDYNETELNFFYDLVNLNAITFDDLDKIDKNINNNKSTLKLEEVTALPNSPRINTTVLDIYRELSLPIKEACDEAKQFIIDRPECKDCELFGKPTIILDTNATDMGEIDIMFVGLNPKADDVEVGKPFSGKDGKILRERMSLIPANIKWGITNVVWCQTKTEADIKNIDDVKTRCRPLSEGIISVFPAKIIVPLGAKAADWFDVKGGMANISGKVFEKNNQKIIPIIHPSAANYNTENLDKFKKDFGAVLTTLNPHHEKVSAASSFVVPEIKTIEPSFSTTGDKFVTTVTPDLTFFDCREIDNKILMIYINEQGQKKYMLNEYNLHFYVKNSSWRDCDQVTEKVDGLVTITGREKGQAIKLVRDKLNIIKNGR